MIHRRFCKFALGLPTSATNIAAYGEIGRGRYTSTVPTPTPVEERQCDLCGVLEDEQHFLINCPLLMSSITNRQKRFHHCSRSLPSFVHKSDTDKFLCIMSSKDLLASFPGLPRFFCSSVSVDNNTRMRKGGEYHCQWKQEKNGVGLGTRLRISICCHF